MLITYITLLVIEGNKKYTLTHPKRTCSKRNENFCNLIEI